MGDVWRWVRPRAPVATQAAVAALVAVGAVGATWATVARWLRSKPASLGLNVSPRQNSSPRR